MANSNAENVEAQLADLRQQVADLEAKVATPPPHWEASGFYTSYYATTGFFLGIAGAVVSLMFNIIGSSMVGQHPLKLIQV